MTRPTAEQIGKTVAWLGTPGRLSFWPPGDEFRMFVAALLGRIMPTPEALRWWSIQMASKIGKWENEAHARNLLRAYCVPLDESPDDPRSQYSDIPGYTPADSEARFMIDQSAETQRLIEEYKREAKQLGVGEREEILQLTGEVEAAEPREVPEVPRVVREVTHQALRHGTPIRTQEEREAIERELAEKLGIKPVEPDPGRTAFIESLCDGLKQVAASDDNRLK